MRKIVLYIAMSLDGYLADPKGGVSWLVGDGSNPHHEGTYESFLATVGSIVMGSTTYHQLRYELSPDHWPYDQIQTYVLSHQPSEALDTVTLINTPIVPFLTELKSMEGKDIWLVGGANVLHQALENPTLIDRYHIAIIPRILGDGIRLFSNGIASIPLRWIRSEEYNGIVELIYEPLEQ
ncbi:MAG: dihydrofolate reductase family protein [Candidatus Izemoplasmatales bacterium]|nr:dihydrofolate reductase family protein [Candidatus Izemoplasmatales bacterium]